MAVQVPVVPRFTGNLAHIFDDTGLPETGHLAEMLLHHVRHCYRMAGRGVLHPLLDDCGHR